MVPRCGLPCLPSYVPLSHEAGDFWGLSCSPFNMLSEDVCLRIMQRLSAVDLVSMQATCVLFHDRRSTLDGLSLTEEAARLILLTKYQHVAGRFLWNLSDSRRDSWKRKLYFLERCFGPEMLATGVSFTLYATPRQPVQCVGTGGPASLEALQSECVVQVAASMHHTLFLTTAGDVWSCGNGDRGQLGHGHIINRLTPARIPCFFGRGMRVRHVSAGGRHSAFVMDSGEMYTCGQGTFGQLGLGSTDACAEPCLVLGDLQGLRIVKVACGYMHTLALTDSGVVFSFGRGRSGCLGLGDFRPKVLFPERVRGDLEHEKATHVAAGDNHSLVLTDKGCVFAMGDGASGKLGLGDQQPRLLPQRIKLPRPVIRVAAGFECSFFLLSSCDVHACGRVASCSGSRPRFLHSRARAGAHVPAPSLLRTLYDCDPSRAPAVLSPQPVIWGVSLGRVVQMSACVDSCTVVDETGKIILMNTSCGCVRTLATGVYALKCKNPRLRPQYNYYDR
eukprot:Rmarinus@m.12923